MSHPDLTAKPDTGRAANIAFGVGVAATAVLFAGYFSNPKTFYQAYLMGFLFWVNMALGCLALVMVQHLTGGAWGVMIRRMAEAGIRTLPMMAVLFVPLGLFGVHKLYKWSNPEIVAVDHVLQHKAPYLNVPGFQIRALVYFALWCGIGYLLVRLSRRQDATGEPGLGRTFARVSAVGGILYFVSMTFASVDWGMSLDPHWFSSMYGVIFIIGQALGAVALLLVTGILLARSEPMRSVFRTDVMHDLGKLMLAFTMLWAYVCFSQYLIIYSANLKEEIPYYIRRGQGGWEFVTVLLVACNFVLPFMVLLSRDVKRSRRMLLWVAVWVAALRYLDLYWMLAPSMRGDSLAGALTWMDAAALAGIGGLWLGMFLRGLGSQPVVPARDPAFQEAMAHGGH